MLVRNAINTGDLTPPNNESWISYWEHRKGIFGNDVFGICPACGRLYFKSYFDGVHVKKTNGSDNRLYIVPLCKACNHRSDAFDIYEKLLVLAPNNFKKMQ